MEQRQFAETPSEGGERARLFGGDRRDRDRSGERDSRGRGSVRPYGAMGR
ncbi:hypothetical protein JMJ58_09725 [Haloterrigena salifodinae]|uniref:Uncharacterized protein n=1 Tax=Haloterrigena salifodinae TaxID=2675099 RepID=A0A8T8E5V3_9EURY|nr:hypothetical protein [Haloterrigena salifodinae]QRV17119.1 hypothetical protein JMJ58_09725 [Haloterrigena salifodinae]